MKHLSLYLGAVATTLCALSAARPQLAVQSAEGALQNPIHEERFLLELSPGETRWVSEDEKWELKRVSMAWPSRSVMS